jgi:proline iminopeptidase
MKSSVGIKLTQASRLKSVVVIAAIIVGSALLVVKPAHAQAVADRGTIPAGKFSLRYRIEGTGRPTVVIGSAIYYPRVFSQNLRKHRQLIFLDHRAFASSPGHVDKTEFALDKLVDDIERARRQLRLEKIAVIGHSGHAFLALEYAKKYAAHVSHVVLIGAAPDFGIGCTQAAEQYWQTAASPERKAALVESMQKMPESLLERLPATEQLVKSYVRIGPRAWYDFHFDASPLWAGVKLNAEGFTYLWNEVFRDIDITKGLSGFDRPVFLALGRYDFIVAPPSSWDQIRPLFRELTVRVFDRSGHTPPYEEPELFDAELLRWFAGHQ